MIYSKILFPAAVLASLLGACTSPEIAPKSMRGEYLADVATRVRSVNWSRVETVDLVLDSFSFTPGMLTFRVGRPYRLRLRSVAGSRHSFTAPDFFKAIALHKVAAVGKDSADPYRLSVDLGPKEGKEVFFVPVKEGIYHLKCSIVGHALIGMRGRIRIVR